MPGRHRHAQHGITTHYTIQHFDAIIFLLLDVFIVLSNLSVLAHPSFLFFPSHSSWQALSSHYGMVRIEVT